MSVLDVEAAPVPQADPALANRARPAVRIIEPKSTALSTFLIVFLLTVVGGALRFAWLDKPALWGDDALTYTKVAGTFPEMLSELQRQGFSPLHYELYWWMRQHTILTPFMMRLVPAVCGTLMIPAMYFLAIQLVNRRAALIATLFTAVSAYMLNYSRDAKMYAELWFFATLSMGCFLWWLRTRTPLSWLCWIAATTAMLGIQLLGFMALGIQLLMVLTAPRQNWKGYFYLPVTALWLAALLAVACVSLPLVGVLGLIYLVFLAANHVRTKYSPTPRPPWGVLFGDVLASVIWPMRWTAIGAGLLLFVALRDGRLIPVISYPWSIWNAVNGEFYAAVRRPFDSKLALVVLAAAVAIISFLIHKPARKVGVLCSVLIALIGAMWLGPLTALVVLGSALVAYGVFSWVIGFDWLAEGVAFAPRYSASPLNGFMYGFARCVTWPAILLFAIGAGLSSYSILRGYALNSNVNNYVENAIEDGQPDGLGWVPAYNRGRQGLDYFQYTATAWLYKWEWPRDYPTLGIRDIDEVDPATRRLLVAAAYTFVGIALLSVLPWSRRLTHDGHPVGAAGRASWRRALWVSGWLVLLPYGVYAFCMPRADSPVEWFFQFTQTTDAPSLARPDLPKFSASTPDKKVLSATPAEPVSTWQWIKACVAEVAGLFAAAWQYLGVFGDYLKGWIPYKDKVLSAVSWQTTRWKMILALLIGGVVYALIAERSLLAAVKRFLCGAAVVTGVLALCMLVAAALPKPMARYDIWIPRYVAIAWPAFAIVVGVLLARLPGKWLRGAAVGFLVVVNLAMHASRLFAGTEPPIDRMVTDQLAAAGSASQVKFFYSGPDGGAPPGTATLRGVVGNYYRTIATGGESIAPREFLWGGRQNNNNGSGRRRGIAQFFGGGDSTLKGFAAEANQSLETQRVVSWDFLPPRKIDQTDALGDALGAQWKRVNEDLFATRDHWTMRDFGTYRRREYVRRAIEATELPAVPVVPPPVPRKVIPPPPKPQPAPAKPATTKPATRPATRPSTRQTVPASLPATQHVARPTTNRAVPATTPAPPATAPSAGVKAVVINPPATAEAVPKTPVTKPSEPRVPETPVLPATLPATKAVARPATVPTELPAILPPALPTTGPTAQAATVPTGPPVPIPAPLATTLPAAPPATLPTPPPAAVPEEPLKVLPSTLPTTAPVRP